MAASVTWTNINDGGNEIVAYGTVALSGNYGSAGTHGDVLNFVTAGTSSIAAGMTLPSTLVPYIVYITEQAAAGAAPSGNQLAYSVGSTQANGQLVMMTGSGTEFTQGNPYSGAILTSTIVIEAHFLKLI